MKDRKLLTLCLIHEHPRILLGMKKRGFGAGRWNGFGGKLEDGETLEEAACREVREEIGIEVDPDYGLLEMGVLEFEFQSDPIVMEVHVFRIESYKGEPVETEEMRPQWFSVDEIPFKQMWTDDVYWFPYFLKGRKFRGRFLFDRPSTADYASRIIEKDIKEVPRN